MSRAFGWLVERWNWPAAAGFAGVVLLMLVPVVWAVAGPVIALIFLQMPVYMLHQVEEHVGDRFRGEVNATIGGGLEVLSRRATFVINSVGVWVLDLVALYLAVFVSPGWGLMAVYLPLVNSVGHIGDAIALKRPNAGLWTALFVFVPVGTASLVVISKMGGATWAMQAVGLGMGLLVHILIIIHVMRRKRALGKS